MPIFTTMNLPKIVIASVVFTAICLSSCKIPPFDSYVDPLYLEEDNPEGERVSGEKK
tara:strand:+ start:30171 stop:30341 length:171 start_codon:yes stop_codon:yes gene_type:complete